MAQVQDSQSRALQLQVDITQQPVAATEGVTTSFHHHSKRHLGYCNTEELIKNKDPYLQYCIQKPMRTGNFS